MNPMRLQRSARAIDLDDPRRSHHEHAGPGRAERAWRRRAGTRHISGGSDQGAGATSSTTRTARAGKGALHADGMDDVMINMTNTSNVPIEAMENEFPLAVERYEMIPDSGGAGRYRGGLGVLREIRMLAPGEKRRHAARASASPPRTSGRQAVSGSEPTSSTRGCPASGSYVRPSPIFRWPRATCSASFRRAAAVSASRTSGRSRRSARTWKTARSRRLLRARSMGAMFGRRPRRLQPSRSFCPRPLSSPLVTDRPKRNERPPWRRDGRKRTGSCRPRSLIRLRAHPGRPRF